jgi:hypothetical protein
MADTEERRRFVQIYLTISGKYKRNGTYNFGFLKSNWGSEVNITTSRTSFFLRIRTKL